MVRVPLAAGKAGMWREVARSSSQTWTGVWGWKDSGDVRLPPMGAAGPLPRVGCGRLSNSL